MLFNFREHGQARDMMNTKSRMATQSPQHFMMLLIDGTRSIFSKLDGICKASLYERKILYSALLHGKCPDPILLIKGFPFFLRRLWWPNNANFLLEIKYHAPPSCILNRKKKARKVNNRAERPEAVAPWTCACGKVYARGVSSTACRNS